MATFMTNLWESVFTPGPTPTLLIATNATFGTLQLLLFVLLLTTSSIHFAILSVLCAGLWYSINWFAREVHAAKAAEDAAAANNSSSKDKQSPTHTRQTSPDPTGSDTETETDPIATTATGSNPTRTAPAQQRRKPPPPQPGQAPMPPPTSAASSSARAPAVTPAPAPRQAPVPPAKQPAAQHLSPNPPTTSAPSTDGAQDLSASASGRRRPSMGDSSGYVSTDSEWEKVSDQEGK